MEGRPRITSDHNYVSWPSHVQQIERLSQPSLSVKLKHCEKWRFCFNTLNSQVQFSNILTMYSYVRAQSTVITSPFAANTVPKENIELSSCDSLVMFSSNDQCIILFMYLPSFPLPLPSSLSCWMELNAILLPQAPE